MSPRLLQALPTALRRPATAVSTAVGRILDARLPGLAAEIAFWILLSLPALLVAGVAAASLISDRVLGPGWEAQVVDRVTEAATIALTPQTIDQTIEPLLERLLDVEGAAGVVSFAFLAAVWTASRAVKTVLTTLAIVYGRGDDRAGWQERLLGFGVTLGALVIGSVLAPLLVAGPGAGEVVEDMTGLELGAIVDIWRAAYWPTVVAVATLALVMLYHFGVPGRTRWRSAVPGAFLATGVWLAGSAALRVYGGWVVDGEGAYGPLAGPIVGLLWLWVTGFAVLLGGLLNASLSSNHQVAHRGSTDPEPDDHEPDGDGSADETDRDAGTVSGDASEGDGATAKGRSNENVVSSPRRLTTPN